MSFLGALLAGQAGMGQGQREGYHDALAHAGDMQQFAEKQREWDQEFQLKKGTQDRQNRYTDAQIKNYESLAKKREYDALRLQQEADQRGTKISAEVKELLARGLVDEARARLADSQSWNIRTERPREFNAKIVQADHLLDKRLGAEKEKYLAQIASRQEIAGLNNRARMDIARLTAERMMAGKQYDAAVRESIAEYQQQMANYRGEEKSNAMAGTLNRPQPFPSAATPEAPTLPPGPTINYNFGGSPFGQYGKPGPQLKKAPANAVQAPGEGAKKALSDARDAMSKHGMSLSEVLQLVSKLPISQSDKDYVLRQLRGAGASQNSGGPQANALGPFLGAVFPQLLPR